MRSAEAGKGKGKRRALRRALGRPGQAYLLEIFSGIQGEGPLVGERQIFLRFAGCNLRCRYCDTPASRHPRPKRCLAEEDPGGRDFQAIANPVSGEALLERVRKLARPGLHRWVSLTGGEPLLQADFLAEWLPGILALRLRTYLETNGTLAPELSRLLPLLDYVAVDLKLPSATGQPPRWAEARAFLELLHAEGKARAVCAKAVVCGETDDDEIALAAGLVQTTAPEALLVLQPVNPRGGALPPPPERMLRLQELAKRQHPQVRVIPQMHRLMGQM